MSKEFDLYEPTGMLDLQLFGLDDDDDGIDTELDELLKDLDGSDDDADDDDDDIFSGLEDDDDDEPQSSVKKRISNAVRTRLAREKAKQQREEENFSKMFGITPKQAYEMALAQAVQNQNNPVPPQPNNAPPMPQNGAPITDPRLASALEYVESRRVQDAMEAEAMEFAHKFPGVTFEQLPEEVKIRRSKGGVSLAEAYSMYLGGNLEKIVTEAKKKGVKETLLGVTKSRAVKTEGADFGASFNNDVFDSFEPEDQEIARSAFGMTPKELAKFNKVAQKARELGM